MAKKKIMNLNKNLVTPFESDTTSSWNEYPRPSFKRDSYLCLNGEWDLSVLRGEEESSLGVINVPFAPETRLSGINYEKVDGEILKYTKKVNIEREFFKGRVLLHFGAVDQICRVYVNEMCVGGHVGGYLPFTIDITSSIVFGENQIGRAHV